MGWRWLPLFIALSLLPFAAYGGTASCFKCHKKAEFQKAVVHKPVKGGECASCHSPHVSRYSGLLNQPVPRLCYSCHRKQKALFSKGRFLHSPVKKGECLKCHNPHSSASKGLLKKSLPGQCYMCHKGVSRKFAHTHVPFRKGRCLACHDPHGSSDYRLLKGGDPGICLRCHKDSPSLKRVHLGYSLKGIQCLSCHSPHGSSRKALVRESLHEPFAQRECGECHDRKDKGPGLCFQCHDEMESAFYTNHNHLLAGVGNPCVSCHSPHASDGKALLVGKEGYLCQRCHGYTYERIEEALYVHPKWDRCTDCHSPHGSNKLAMLHEDENRLCARCHETQGKFTHPVGEKFRDPRNGQPITCVTCHDPMGTMFKYNLKRSGDRDLCIQCHKSY